MNPANNYDIHGAANQAVNQLNRAIDQLKERNFDQGRKGMQIVIDIIRGMNIYYDQNYLISVDAVGTRLFQPSAAGSSAAYNYGRNARNIEKIVECMRLLNLPNPQTDLVIGVLEGKCELPNSKV